MFSFDFYLEKKHLIFVVVYFILTFVYKILFQHLLKQREKNSNEKSFLQQNLILFFINLFQFIFSFFVYYVKNENKNKKNEIERKNTDKSNEIPNLKEKINISSFQDFKKPEIKFFNLKIFSLIFVCAVCDVAIFNFGSKYFYHNEILNTNFNNVINFLTLIFFYGFNKLFRNQKLYFFNYFCLLIFVVTNFFCVFIEIQKIKTILNLFLKFSMNILFICLISIKIIFEKKCLDFKVNPFKINCIEGLFEIIIFGVICFVDIFINFDKQQYKILYDSLGIFYYILNLVLIIIVYLHKIIEINLIKNYSIYIIFFGYCYFILLNLYFLGIKNFHYFYFFIFTNDFLTLFSVFILNKMIILNICDLNNSEIMSQNSIDDKSNSNNNSSVKSESNDSSYISNNNNNNNNNI